MLKRLRTKWQVTGWQFTLIIITFALGGSVCGRLGRHLAALIEPTSSALFWPLAIVFMTLLWPISVLVISIPLGQYRFFSNYLRRIGKRIGLRK